MPSNSTIFDPLRLILVAVQAPEETRPLLELALSFYNQDGSNITVLHVSLEGAEKESQTLAELHSIVE